MPRGDGARTHGRSGAGRLCRGGGRGRGRGGLLEPALLAVLAGGEAHGYALLAAVEEMTDGQVCADPGGVYRILRRLEEEGSVVSDWVEGESGPQRRTYRITGDGRDLLRWWMTDMRVRASALVAISDAAEAALEEKE